MEGRKILLIGCLFLGSPGISLAQTPNPLMRTVHQAVEKEWEKHQPARWNPVSAGEYLYFPFWFLYKRLLSPQLSRRCAYVPSCSSYMFTALKRFGIVGIWIGTFRVLRCNPVALKDQIPVDPFMREKLRAP